jgi:hypothetical protein
MVAAEQRFTPSKDANRENATHMRGGGCASGKDLHYLYLNREGACNPSLCQRL